MVLLGGLCFSSQRLAGALIHVKVQPTGLEVQDGSLLGLTSDTKSTAGTFNWSTNPEPLRMACTSHELAAELQDRVPQERVIQEKGSTHG